MCKTHNSELNKKLSYRRDSARRRSLRRLRSFKVTDFDNSRKPVCDFIVVINNTNSYYLAPFPSYCKLFVKFGLSTRGREGTSLLTHSFGLNPETPKLTTTIFGLKKLETSLYPVVQNAFRYLEQGAWLTSTDR